MSTDPSVITGIEDIYDALNNYSYWYEDPNPDNDPDLDKVLKYTAAAEFYAECFEYGVLEYDMTPTCEVFGNSYVQFQESINQIWNDIPHQEGIVPNSSYKKPLAENDA